MIKSVFSFSLITICALAFVSCNDNPATRQVVATTFTNLAADPPTGFTDMGAPIGTTGKFTFFSFKTGALVDHADSATTQWDIGFRATTIIVNSATSGPGTSQVQVVSGIFDDILEAPADGYTSDNDPSPIEGVPNANLAIPTGSDQGWYNATQGPPPTIITPIAGKVLVIKTSDNRFAKVEVLSYYQDAPASPTGNEPSRYYTFRYVYQPNDTRSFN